MEDGHIDFRSWGSIAEQDKEKYTLGLCTVFVATIEEAKERISQLELIFCSQLFPAFQSELLQCKKTIAELDKVLNESREEWERARKSLLQNLQDLQSEKDSEIKCLIQQQEVIRTKEQQERLIHLAQNHVRDELQQKQKAEIEELRHINQQILSDNKEVHCNLRRTSQEAEDLRNRCEALLSDRTELYRRHEE
eukprot:c38852_g1_i1 orf=233-814(+)